MATAVVLPKQGQSVESCLITGWKKKVGDPVAEGELLCEVETDKALLEIESTATGTLLAQFFQAGDEVPVLTHIAAIGEPGEDISGLRPAGATDSPKTEAAPPDSRREAKTGPPVAAAGQTLDDKSTPALAKDRGGSPLKISPRARNLAARQELDIGQVELQGTGPEGRIIERDIQAALAQIPKMTPLAKSMVSRGGFVAPGAGSGVSGRVMAKDLSTVAAEPAARAVTPEADEVQTIPVKGVRKVIANRMLNSLQTTAQLTLNTSADARALLAYRQRLKNSPEPLELQDVTINDLILLAVSRILPQYPQLNAHFSEEAILQYKNVHLGLAVDTPRGLMVPVIRNANHLSLRQISREARRLALACVEGKAAPDELSGGTFTVTNLGSFGIENFTPVLNPPEVGILGVGNINLKPIQVNNEVEFVQHLGLSLTINHQAVDGAPAARFLQALAQGIAALDLLLAV
jgi:pyruvate dehydrogenase E2 component (dihydrolipoamide acetyltransferase)